MVALRVLVLDVAREGHRLADGEATLEGDDPLRHVREAVLIEDRVLEADVDLVDAATVRALEDRLVVGAAEVVVGLVRVGRVEAALRDDAVADRRAVVPVGALLVGAGRRAVRGAHPVVVLAVAGAPGRTSRCACRGTTIGTWT
jgi:hypothetical protein